MAFKLFLLAAMLVAGVFGRPTLHNDGPVELPADFLAALKAANADKVEQKFENAATHGAQNGGPPHHVNVHDSDDFENSELVKELKAASQAHQSSSSSLETQGLPKDLLKKINAYQSAHSAQPFPLSSSSESSESSSSDSADAPAFASSKSSESPDVPDFAFSHSGHHAGHHAGHHSGHSSHLPHLSNKELDLLADKVAKKMVALASGKHLSSSSSSSDESIAPMVSSSESSDSMSLLGSDSASLPPLGSDSSISSHSAESSGPHAPESADDSAAKFHVIVDKLAHEHAKDEAQSDSQSHDTIDDAFTNIAPSNPLAPSVPHHGGSSSSLDEHIPPVDVSPSKISESDLNNLLNGYAPSNLAPSMPHHGGSSSSLDEHTVPVADPATNGQAAFENVQAAFANAQAASANAQADFANVQADFANAQAGFAHAQSGFPQAH